jgi:hypothetical protein
VFRKRVSRTGDARCRTLWPWNEPNLIQLYIEYYKLPASRRMADKRGTSSALKLDFKSESNISVLSRTYLDCLTLRKGRMLRCAVLNPATWPRTTGRMLMAKGTNISVAVSFLIWVNMCRVVDFYSHICARDDPWTTLQSGEEATRWAEALKSFYVSPPFNITKVLLIQTLQGVRSSTPLCLERTAPSLELPDLHTSGLLDVTVRKYII